MSADQAESNTTQQPPKAPVLCKMGCGFFGSDATGNCCSKCWMDSLKEKAAASPAPDRTASPAPAEEPSTKDDTPDLTEEETPVETLAPVVACAPTKKKKKKTSYKSMMSSMMAGNKERDVKAEQRDKLSKGLGGGKFSKIEKI